MEGHEDIQRHHHTALTVWAVCVAIVLVPSILVWIVRGAGYAEQCVPGPDLCRGMMLGGGLRDTLALAWSVGTDVVLLVGLSFLAMAAAFVARKPLTGTLSLLFLPFLALALPSLAVYTSKYDDCAVSSDGIGNCRLWGADMGMSFHTAASVPDIVLGIAPYCVALVVMMGIIGWFFARPRPRKPTAHATAHMRQFYDDGR